MRRVVAGLLAAFLVLGVPASAWAQSEGQTPSEQEGDSGGGKIPHESEECIKLLEKGNTPEACQEAPNPILPATNELIWGALAFLLLFVLLAKLAFPAIKKSMDDRTERIRTSLDEAERVRAEAQQVQEQYQRQLADARNEAARIIEEARQTADQVRRDLTARAEAEATELRQRNAEQIEGERQRVMSELQGQVADLAVELAERVVEANLDREANLRLIENYINSLPTQARS